MSCKFTMRNKCPNNLAKGRIAVLSPSRLRVNSSDLDAHLTHGSLDPNESAPKTASRSVQPFLHSSSVYPTHTDKHTDHATCDICSNRLHFMHCVQAMRPKNVNVNNTSYSRSKHSQTVEKYPQPSLRIT